MAEDTNNRNNPGGLFRDKSIQKITSPDQLNDYMRVASPGVWTVLAAIIILLVGFCVWGIYGDLSTTVNAVCINDNDVKLCFVSEEDISRVEPGMKVVCEESVLTIKKINEEPFEAAELLSEYANHIAGYKDGEWVHAIAVSGDMPEGTNAALVIVDQVKPISFILS